MPAPTAQDKANTKVALEKAHTELAKTIKRLDATTDPHEIAEIKGAAAALKAIFDINGVC